MENQKEIWKDIPGYGGDYQVSTLGKIKSVKRNAGIILRPDVTKRGYCRVTLYGNNTKSRKSVHRIVGRAFKKNPFNKDQINHKDGNPQNNEAANLEWCNGSENMKHAYEIGLIIPPKNMTGRSYGTNPNANIILNKVSGIYYTSMKEAAESHDMNYQTLSNMLNGHCINKTNLIKTD